MKQAFIFFDEDDDDIMILMIANRSLIKKLTDFFVNLAQVVDVGGRLVESSLVLDKVVAEPRF